VCQCVVMYELLCGCQGVVCVCCQSLCVLLVCARESVHVSEGSYCAGRLLEGGLCADLKYCVFLTGPTTRNSKRKAQDGGDISGSAGSGSAEVPGTHVCGVVMCRKCVVMCKSLFLLRVFQLEV
jgi:hypothetical protein